MPKTADRPLEKAPPTPAAPKPKSTRDMTGFELRSKARGGDTKALAELERRRQALHGAVIPAWEIEARGPDYLDWDLTA